MKRFNNTENIECNKKIVIKDWFNRHSYVCDKIATHTNGKGVYRCRHHSLTGRFVARMPLENGDLIGKIVARFDTEQELRDNIYLFPGCKMQKLTKSHRKDLY